MVIILRRCGNLSLIYFLVFEFLNNFRVTLVLRWRIILITKTTDFRLLIINLWNKLVDNVSEEDSRVLLAFRAPLYEYSYCKKKIPPTYIMSATMFSYFRGHG